MLVLSLDWWIIGAHFGSNKVDMKSNGDYSTTNKVDYINTAKGNVDQIPLVTGFSATMNDTEATMKFGFPLGLRTGLCIGFRF